MCIRAGPPGQELDYSIAANWYPTSPTPVSRWGASGVARRAHGRNATVGVQTRVGSPTAEATGETRACGLRRACAAGRVSGGGVRQAPRVIALYRG